MSTETTMYEYWQEQPTVLQDVFANRQQYCEAFSRVFTDERPDRLYLIASGTSLNAALVAAPVMEAILGVETAAFPASDIPRIYGEKPFLVFVSQGGNSTNTIAAIQALQQYPHLALTGAENCRVNEISPHMLIRCGEETAGPKTKGYTATVLILCLMAAEASRVSGRTGDLSWGEATQELGKALQSTQQNLAEVQAWHTRNQASLQKLDKCVVVGKGLGAQVAREATLKLQETILIPVSGYEFEEFLHGPSMALDEHMGGIYLMPPKTDPDYGRMAALVKFHRSICPMVYAVSTDADDAVAEDCPVGAGNSWYTRVFAWILPSQLMGALLPGPRGVEGKGLELFWKLDAAVGIKFMGRA